MRMGKEMLLVLFGFGLILNGCATLELREANHELADLYMAKSEAVRNRQWEQEVTVNAALSALADEAAAHGGDRTMPVVNRISFYRIAATAAWQAGDGKVVGYGNDGFSLCTPDNYGKAPRDCGMLSVIPDFASVDELTGKIDDIRGRLIDDPDPRTEQEVGRLFDDLRSRIESLLGKRDRIRKSSAPPELAEGVDNRIGALYCLHLRAVSGLIVQAAGVGSPLHRKSQCDGHELQVKLKKLGFSPQAAPCLPPGEPVKPQDCR